MRGSLFLLGGLGARSLASSPPRAEENEIGKSGRE